MKKTALAMGFALMLGAGAANAAIQIFTFTDSNVGGPGNWGSIKLEEVGTSVEFTVTPSNNGAVMMFGLQATGVAATDFVSLPSKFGVDVGGSAGPLGSFDFVVATPCNNLVGCVGNGNGATSPLKFTVLDSKIADFGLPLSENNWSFGAHAIRLDPTVGKDTSHWIATQVPEPSTYALMAAGLAAVGFAARRRKA